MVHVSLTCVCLTSLVLLRLTILQHFLPYKVTLAIKIYHPIQHSTKKK